MKFVYNGYTYDNEFLEKLNESLNDISAFDYNKFLNRKINNSSIIDAVYLLDRNVPITEKRPKDIGSRKLTLNEQISLVSEFFSKLGFASVESILKGINPLYKTNFLPKEKAGGAVGHSGYNEFLEFDFEYTETVHSASILAHEIGHALSSNHIKTAKLAKLTNETAKEFGKNSKDFIEQRNIFREFCDSKALFQKDCISEIESHISEKLFMHFLINKCVISQEEFDDYISTQNNSLHNNLTLMIEENEILSRVHNPITEQDCVQLYNTFKNSSLLNPLLIRIRTMAERKTQLETSERREHSKHRFRYIVGEVVSSVWFNKYLHSSKEEKRTLIDLYKNYLQNSDSFSLENCYAVLLGKDYTLNSILNEYLNLCKSQNVTI